MAKMENIHAIAFETLGKFAADMVKQKEFDLSLLKPDTSSALYKKWEGEKIAYESVLELFENLKKSLNLLSQYEP